MVTRATRLVNITTINGEKMVVFFRNVTIVSTDILLTLVTKETILTIVNLYQI
jgi:hypothetical protein